MISVGASAWRRSVSMRPISRFAGIDRTLTQGASADPLSAPLSFPADEPAHARLLAGPVTDLNVMTRRSECRHAVRRLHVRPTLVTAWAADQTPRLRSSPATSPKLRVAPRDRLLAAPAEGADVLRRETSWLTPPSMVDVDEGGCTPQPTLSRRQVQSSMPSPDHRH